MGVLVFGKILNLNWQKLWYWANFHCCRWPIYFDLVTLQEDYLGIVEYRRTKRQLKKTTIIEDRWDRLVRIKNMLPLSSSSSAAASLS